jgi:hypothetical protein
MNTKIKMPFESFGKELKTIGGNPSNRLGLLETAVSLFKTMTGYLNYKHLYLEVEPAWDPLNFRNDKNRPCCFAHFQTQSIPNVDVLK